MSEPRTLVLPPDYPLTDDELRAALRSLAEAKVAGDADVHLAFSGGTISRHVVLIRDRDGRARGLVGGRPRPAEF